MGDEGKVVIELVGKDSATQTFVKSFQDMQASFQRMEASGSRSAASLSSIEKNAMLAGNAVGSMTAKLLTLASLSYVGYRLAGGFQEAIKSIDNYKTQTIQIASTLTSLSEKGQGPIDEQFGRNLAYAEQMYRAINLESAKHFSSANNMMTVYNRLTQEGYGVRLQEVKALGQVSDLIKMYAGDQQLEKQLNQEIRAIMNGQARSTDALAMSLKAQLGPGWKKLVDKHRQAGDLLQWIVSLYPGLDAATGKITNTWSAQYATAQSLLELLSINGLGGAYQEIVNYLKSGNEYLRTHGDVLETRIQKAWGNIGPIVFGVANAMVKIADAGLQFAQDMDRIANNPALMALFGAALGGRLGGIPGAIVGGVAAGAYPAAKMLGEGAGPGGDYGFGFVAPTPSGLIGYGTKREGDISGPSTPTKLKKPPGQEGEGTGAAKSQEAAINRVRSIMDTLTKEYASLAESSGASIDAWTAKMMHDLDKQAAKGAEVADAQVLVWQVAAAKRQKVDDEFDKWWFGASNDRVAAAGVEQDSLTKKWGDTADHRQKIEAAMATKISLIRNQQESEQLNLTQGYLNQMVKLVPSLEEELKYKRLVLDLEREQADLQLNRSLLENKITRDVYDQAKAMQAVVNQFKEYQYQREALAKGGVQEGLGLWGVDRAKKGETSTTDAVVSLMGELETGTSRAVSGGIISALQGQQFSIEQIFMNAAASGITKGFDYISDLLFSGLANIFKAAMPSVLGGGGGGGFGWDFMYSGGAYHQGGILKAHSGLKLGPREGLFLGLEGERVLSPQETRDYELGGRTVTAAPQVNLIINNNAPNTEARGEMQANGDIIATIDQLTAGAYNRRGLLYKAFNSGGGSIKR